ncbi:MAG TPA: protein-L-isoaspartate(D-aspartate) O-methyltransferase [Terriglobales bacterium]|jgi:protein-L-isoaspartate(D-aspartate) O-methyltransferase|nr:protein-L-isoaspartate(D-aspartate) O-methyltransferase [Terriglobales bacterium]
MSQSEVSSRDQYASERFSMVEAQLRRRGIHDERVLDAMLRVRRHEFVPEPYRRQAYGDHPLPIGEGQTISQPFIVAASLQALALNGSESVLEVGTGSGYQTALLALLAKTVYSIERFQSLAHYAEANLARLGFANFKVAVGDGSQGWRDFAPYDAMLVSAAAPSVPQSLLDQLSDSGKMVIPVGRPDSQELQLIQKRAGQYQLETIEGCRFVPLIGAEGY